MRDHRGLKGVQWGQDWVMGSRIERESVPDLDLNKRGKAFKAWWGNDASVNR